MDVIVEVFLLRDVFYKGDKQVLLLLNFVQIFGGRVSSESLFLKVYK